MSYVTFAHPAKDVRRNEMPFGRNTHVIQSNIVLERSGPPWEREIWGSEHGFIYSNPQFTLMPPATILLSLAVVIVLVLVR